MLPVHAVTIRITLHVLAATIWVGGQLTLAGLVPALRAAGPDVPRAAARAFNRIAWPAFVVLVLTGVWNVTAVHRTGDIEFDLTLAAKLVVVALSGLSAFMHSRSGSRLGLAFFGAVSALSAVFALFLGVLLGRG
ncbi:MAG: hypothetical protein NVSMB12_03720 [Acidimicrobiales bacterium]